MPLTQLAPPYPIFTDKNGDPLDAGFIYFGVANDNPETNPIQVYYDRGFTQPVAQPVRTSNGYIMRNGSPALIYADSQFSVTVRNKRNELVIYSPTGYGVTPGIPFAVFDNAAKDVATLLADTHFTYNPAITGTVQVSPGDILRTLAEGFAYEVAASGATDQHVTTAGGVKLYVLPGDNGYNVKAFGAVGDGVADDTAIINSTIEKISPFPYDPAFVNNLGSQAGEGVNLFFPKGSYLITDTILLNPNLTLEGEGGGVGSLGLTLDVGSRIIAGANMSGFMLDTAPWYKPTGTRVKSAVGSFPEFDTSQRQVVGGVALRGLRITSNGFAVYGGVNLVNALSSRVHDCAIMGQGVAMRVSSSWLYDHSNNLLRAGNIGYYANGVTTAVAENNYIIFDVVPYPGFTYPTFGSDTNVGVSPRGATLIATNIKFSNIIEGAWPYGIVTTFNNGTVLDGNYMEGITTACYVSEATNLYVRVGYTQAPAASLWLGQAYNKPNQGVVLDWSEQNVVTGPGGLVGRVNVAKIVQPGNNGGTGNSITLKPLSNVILGVFDPAITRIELPYLNAFVTGSDASNNTQYLYVSSTGADTNFGTSPAYPMKSLNAALVRSTVLSAERVQIILQNGETIYTGTSATDTTVTQVGLGGMVTISGADFKATGSVVKPILQQSGNGTNNAITSFNASPATDLSLFFLGLDIRQKAASPGITADDGIIRINRPMSVMFELCDVVIDSNLLVTSRRVVTQTSFYVSTVTKTGASATIYGDVAALNTICVHTGSIAAGITRGVGNFIFSDIP